MNFYALSKPAIRGVVEHTAYKEPNPFSSLSMSWT